MRKPHLASLVLVPFVMYVMASPALAHAPNLMAARAMSEATSGEPLSIGLVVGGVALGPVGWVAVGVVGAAVGGYAVYKNWDRIKDGWSQLGQAFSGSNSRASQVAAERARETARAADAAARAAADTAAAARNADRLARAREYTNQLATAYHAARAQAADAEARLAAQEGQLAGIMGDGPTDVHNLGSSAHDDVLATEAAHNAEVQRLANAVNDGISKARASGGEGADIARGPPLDGSGGEPPPSPGLFGQRSGSDFRTQPKEPGYEKLVETERYIQAASESLTPDTPHLAERASHLVLANMAVGEADIHFAEGDVGLGNGILEYANLVADDVFSYDSVRDKVSEGSTFVAGIISGVTGLPGQPIEGYERAWALGQVVGGCFGLAADVTAGIAGISAALGSGGLAVASGGILAPAAAMVAGEGAVVATAAAGAGAGHAATIKKALDKLIGAEEGGGRSAPEEPTPPKAQQPDVSRKGATRLPVEGNNGRWAGQRGDSPWHSTHPDVNAVTQGEPVPFQEGYPDFEPWGVEKASLEGFETRYLDNRRADEVLAQKMGLSGRRAATEWRVQNNLRWHHHQDGKTMQLVPEKLHDNIPHTGGFSTKGKR